jgi:uncharacterized membrane protein YgaE (UPF0421/DUF939 family)
VPRLRPHRPRALPAPRALAERGRERAASLMEEAATRYRTSARERLRRLLRTSRTLVQVPLAAAVAWLIATELLGHQQPFFAPVAAMITLGITLGERPRRAAELALGVALGIAVADLLVLALGTGTLQLALVVFLAMSAALLLGSGQLFATQAAVSAALVATIDPPSDGVSFTRFLDALVGGGVALAVSAFVLPAHPVALVRSAADKVLDELAATLDDIADAVEAGDRARVERVLLRARDVDPLARDLADAVETAREAVRWGAPRRGARPLVDAWAAASTQIDLAVRNVRVLARGTIRAVDLEENIPPEVVEAIRDLADAVHAIPDAVEQRAVTPQALEHAARAAGRATRVLARTGNLSVNVLVGQIRATAVDLLRAAGWSYEAAVAAVRAATEAAEAAESG